MTSFCSYDVLDNGWSPVSQPPMKLIYRRNKGYVWFANSNGDFVACVEMEDKGICAGIYELYRKEGTEKYA